MGTTGGASDGEAASANTYATLAQLRIISPFTEADISDSDVNALLSDADRAILRLATIEINDEELIGGIDGTNKIFTTEHTPIADIGFNKTITKDDVTVHLVDYDGEGNPVSTEAEVSEVDARDGIITLVTAPTTVNAEAGLIIDYRYYKSKIDFDMLTLAANYYLAHLCEMRKPDIIGESRETVQSSRWLALALSQLPFAKPSLEMSPR
jgi:hypothetical protein